MGCTRESRAAAPGASAFYSSQQTETESDGLSHVLEQAKKKERPANDRPAVVTDTDPIVLQSHRIISEVNAQLVL